MLRASGVNYDIRKVDNYGIYTRFIPRPAWRPRRLLRSLHDAGARDARESSRFCNRRWTIPSGPIIDPKAKLRGFRPTVGEAYGRIEAPKASWAFT